MPSIALATIPLGPFPSYFVGRLTCLTRLNPLSMSYTDSVIGPLPYATYRKWLTGPDVWAWTIEVQPSASAKETAAAKTRAAFSRPDDLEAVISNTSFIKLVNL